MSYSRHINRKNERLGAKNKREAEISQLTHKVLSTLLAAGLVMSPTAVFAADTSQITRANGDDYVADKNGVFNIYAQQYNGKNNAVNQFKNFQLGANQIANMYFHTEKDSREALNLLNFVDTRIDINGTLNAIRNKQIGGNLFFLSPGGMAVGKSGVINTGSLYVMAPSWSQDLLDKDQRSYEILKGNFATGNYGDTELEAIQNGSANIRINASGTISVLGKINATNEVKLYAGKVAVGKNLTDDTIGGTAAGDIVKEAAITTGVADFSQMVKLSDQQQKDMGLTTKLTAAQDGSGDVVLSARSDAANSLDQAFNDLVNTTGVLGGTDINIPKTITASVENYGTVTAAGDATLTAKATNGYFKEEEETYSSNASGFAQTVAKVDVQGNVTAKGAVDMKASADNTYVDSGNSLTDKLGDTLSYVVPVSANVMLLKNEASVTVGKDATVTGDAVKAEAEANLDGTAGTVAAGKKYLKKIPSEIPAAGVSYAQVDNNATVQIDGMVKATGQDTTDRDGNKQEALQVEANATSSVTNSANALVSAGLLGAGSSSIVTAVAVTNSDNNAQIKVNGTAEAQKGSVKMDADATQSLNTAAAAQAPDTAVGTAAVDVIVHDGDASIDVQGTVKADQDVTLTATNHTAENTHSANNNLGQGKFKAQLMKGVMKAADVQGIVAKVKENPLVKDAMSKASKNTGTPASSGSTSSKSLTDTLGNTLSAGAAITVADETTTARVKFGKNSVTEAKNGSLEVSANNTVYDTLLTASGVTSTFKNTDSDSDTVTIAVGTVFGGMKNSASVTVEDGTKDQKAQLKAGKDLSLKTSTRMDYNRVTEIKKGLDESLQAVKAAAEDMKNWEELGEFGDLKTIYDNLVTLEGKLENMSITFYENYLKHTPDGTNLTAEGTLNEVTNLAATGWDLYNQFLELQNAAMDLYADIQAQDPLFQAKQELRDKVTNLLASPMDVVSSSMEYLSPNNYANISAAASAKGGADTAVATAASVTVSDFNFDSQVKVGKNAQLTAGDTLKLQADEAIKDVTMTGKSKFWLNNAATGKSDGVGIGGSFDYQDFDNATLVQVDKGASLTAGDMALASNSDVFHTGVMLSAGKADGSAISGMMALTNSDSSNQVLVDKDALLKAVKDEANNRKGSIAITGYNNTNVNNAILSLSAGSGAAAAGIAVAVNNIDVTNRAAVENITTADDDDDKGQIEAASLQVNAETTGLMNAVSVAGGVTSSGTDPEKGKTEKGGMGSVGNLFGKVTNPVGTVTSAVGTVSNKVKDAITWVNTGGKSQGGTQTAVPTQSDTAPSFSLAGAGSLSLNLVDDTTQAVVDGATVKLNNDGAMSVGARDTAYVGAYSGGAAISLRKGKGSQDNTSVAFSGAVGMNSIDNTIEAAVRNSTLTGVKSLDIEALSGGTSVAAGTALALTKSGQAGNNFAGGASASVNLIDKDVKALAENNAVTGKSATEKANVDVTAYESDLQITGGVNADVAIGGGNAAGGSLTVANIKNNLEAGIHGGTYTNIEDTQVQGLLATKQISAAISAGVAVGGNGTDNAFTGAMLYNGLHNTVSADIADGANITADSIAVKAHDTTSGSAEAKPYEDKLGTYRVKESLLQDAGVDTDGSSYYKTSDAKNGLDTAGEKVDFDGNKGSLSVGAAFVVAGSKDNAAGAAVNVANLDNTFTAKIDGATLTAGTIASQAEADSLAVNVTAGVAAGSKDFGGMGSVTWQDQDNRIQSQVTDSALTTDDLKVHASSNAQAVNVAGSVAYGKTAGVGAALAYNGLDNHIGAYLAGGSVTAKTPSTGVSVDVEGKNTGKIYGLGAAVAASQTAAVNGTVVVNHGGSDTEAAVGEVRPEDGNNTVKATAIANAKAVKVKAESDDVRVAAAGNVSASGKVALGGAVAYNDVGGASASTEKASQKTRAVLNKTTLTHVTSGSTSVQAVDDSTLTTAAVGVGGAGKVAVQGAAATALVNKAVTAEVQDSTVDKDTDKGAYVTVQADSKSTINSLAVVGAGGSDFAGGAGVSVNRINQDTTAALSGSTVRDRHTTVQAAGDSAITSIGVGAAVAGKAALAGNIAVNQIGNNVKAAVTGSTLTSSGNIGVLASGKETLTNFAGTVSGAAGNAGLGMGVSYNAITGNTESTVEDSSLEARGKENGTVGDKQKGVVVTASGQHALNSVALTAGLAGSDNVAVGAAGTVTVNNIGGTTRAAVTGTDINAKLDNSTADDVAVKAQDVTTSESHVGVLSVGIGADGGAGVSAASDTLLLSRNTAAELSGTDTGKKTVNGRNVAVTADQKSEVITNADGVAGAGGVYGAGAVAATAAATKLDGSVTATMKNIISINKGLEISAKHDHKTTLISASAAVSAAMASGAVGAGVGVVNDEFTTEAELAGSTVTAKKDSSLSDSGSVNVAADSSTGVTTVVAGVAGSVGAAASTISVNNVNSQTSAVVDNSTVGAEQDFTVDAHNKVTTKFNAATLGAGGAAIATGVGVNTIGTSTLAKVNQSTVTARKAAVASREELDVDQNLVGATVGGLGINANVMVTSIGTKLADTYGSSDNKGASFDTASVLAKANTALDSQKTATTDDTTASSKVVKDTLHNTDTGVATTDASGVTASSGKSDAKGTQVAVTNSAITTADTLDLSADRKTNAQITAASASVSGSLGLSATVAVLDAKKDAGVSISGSTLQANNALSVTADQSGKTSIDAYQANIAGVAAVSAAYAQSSSSGETTVEAVDSTLTSDNKDITMKAADASRTASSVYGATAGLVTAGALVSEADNTSNTNLAIKGSTLETAQGTADLQADKVNVVSARTYGGSFGLAGANGVVAMASDEGVSKILIAQSDSKKKSAFSGQTASLQATTRPAVTAETGSLSVALLSSASASVATASAKGEAGVQVADGTTFDVDKAAITASAESQNGENNSEAKVKGFAAAGRGTAVVNTATANTDIDTDVTMGKVSFKKNKGTALNVTSANTTQTAADARGITVGGLFASGTNLAYTGSGMENDANTAAITLTGDQAQLKSLTVNASGTTHNLTTADGSGGGMISGDLAGAVDNKTYTGSKVTLKGSWDVNGDVTIQSAQTDHMDLNADATKAAIVGASATKADNTASGAADVILTGSQITSSGTLTAKADSKANLGQNKTYAVEGSGYGGVAVQGAKLNNTVNRTATVDAGHASLASSGSQTLAAESGGKINAAGYIKAAGAGAATWVDVDNTLTSQNTITTDGKTSLRTDTAAGDITLSASDDWAVTAKGVADTQGGAVGGASSDVKNTLQRTNKVDVQGKVYSLNDVNLYAGKDANGAMDNLDLTVESEAYNKTALSVAVPKFKDTLIQANQVVVGQGADVAGVRHVNAYADEADKYLREQSVKYTWYHSDAKENFTSTSVGKKSDSINDKTDNYVQIDGKVTAGAQNKQKIVIGGSGQIVVLDKDELAAVQAVKGQEKAVQRPTIEASDNIDTSQITYASIDYANALMARYYELSTLIGQYSDSKDLTALKGYQDEQTRIYNELNDLGLLSKATGADGKEYLVPVSGLTVDTIVLPDIVASGGNIVVEAGSLKGAGTLKAQGSPEVTVENHTNLYMKVGDVKAVNPGGEIHYNGQSLAKDAAAVIKSANQDKAAAVNLTVSTDAATSTGGTVTIKSDYGTSAIKAKIDEVDAEGKKTGKKIDAELVPKADIEINGNVEAENGVVTVEDKNYNILLQGEGSRTAEVNGKEIHLTAGKSISQGFTQGIVNIGGNPEELYKNKYFNSDVNDFNGTYGYETTRRIHDEDRTHDEMLNGSGSRIAGDNIYINASDINVNGLIQSGYGKYEVTIDDTVTPKVQNLNRSWALMGKQDLSDAVITTGSYYLVQQGGKVLQSDGTYKYQPDVYYNPSTQKLVIPDIDAHGGKIYLSGRISSTGNGKIVALDGAYDISVTNPTKTDLQVGKLISNKNDGLISIADSSTNRLTEYTRGSTVVKDLTKWDKTTGDWKVLSTSGASSQYNPQENLRYNWTSGQKVTTRKHYKHDHKAGLWGAVTTLNETELEKYEQEITPQDMGHNTFTNDNGVYIDTSSLTNKDKQYVFVYDNVVLNNSRTQPVVTERWKTGFLGWFHWERTEWDTNTGTAQQYVGSVKADHGINIGFLGNQNGNSAINVTSQAGVTLAGRIQSSQSGAGSTIAITLQEGAINQKGGLLKGDNIKLSAKTGLTNIAIESLGDTVKIDAANTGSGNMNITVDGAYGKAGHVDLVQAKNSKGDVSLTVLGNLTQNGTAAAVEGNRIDLVSRQGSIGTDTSALKVKTPDTAVDALNPLSSSVNVTAKGNIHLAEDSDMRVGIIQSTDGDVKLNAAGSLIDALPSGDIIDRGNTATLVQGWKDLGLIEGDGQYKQKQAEDVAEYKAGVQSEMEQYLKLKTAYENNEEAARNDANYQVLKDRYGDYTSADDYLAKSDTAQNHLADLQKAGAGWTENELLYAISDAIVNKQQGSTDTELKQASISGNNITLQAKNIGSDKAAEDVLVKDITTDARLDDLKKVVNANVSDVGYTENDKGEKVFRIYGKVPVGIEAKGELNVQSDGNIYVAGRTSGENKDTVLKLGNVTTNTGDIRILGKAGVTNSLTDGSANLKGKDLILEGGSADIGTADKKIAVDLTGSLSALTEGSMYISSVGGHNLQLTGLYAGKDMVLDSTKDILMSPAASAQAYLNAGSLLDLKAAGSIGAKDSGVRILGNGTTINAETKDGNIYLAGKSKAGETEGLLLLGTLKTVPSHTISVASETSLSLGKDDETSPLDSQVTADAVSLSSDSSINLAKGSLTTDNLALKAGGYISQTAGHAIAAPTVSLDAVSGIDLKSGAELAADKVFNDFQSVTVKNGSDATDVIIGSGGSKDLTVSFNNDSKAKNVTVHNYKNGEVNNLTVNGPVTVAEGISLINDEADLKTRGTLTVGSGRLHEYAVGALENEDALTGEDIILNSTKGMTNKSLIATNQVELTAADDILNQGIVQAGTYVSMKSDTGSITNKGDVEAKDGGVTMDAKTDLNNQGAVTASQSVNLKSDTGSITNKGNVEAKGGDVAMDAKTDLRNLGVVKASQDAGLKSGGSMANEQAVTAGRNLTMDAGTTLTNGGALTAENGAVSLTSQKELLNKANVQAGTSVTMTSAGSSITNAGAVTVDQGVTMTAGDSIANQAAVQATKAAISLTAQKDITQTGNVLAGTSVLMDSQNKGNILVTGDVVSGTDTRMKTKDGSITVGTAGQKNTVQAGTTAELTSETGDITVYGTVTTKNGAKLQAANKGSILIDGDLLATESGNAEALTKDGNITINGKTKAETGDVKALTEKGNVHITGQMDAGQNVTAQSDNGSVSIGGTVTGGTSVTTQATKGNISVNGSMEAKGGDLHLQASDSQKSSDKGNIDVKGTLKASQAVAVSTDDGSITIGTSDKNGTVDAGTTATLTTVNGPITVYGTVTAKNGAKLQATKSGAISLKGDLLTTDSGNAEALSQDGNIEIQGKVESKHGEAAVKTKHGSVNVNGQMHAAQNAVAESGDGNVTIDGTVVADTGNAMARTDHGDVNVKGLMKAGNDVMAQSDRGSVTIDGSLTSGHATLAQATGGDVSIQGDVTSGTSAEMLATNGSVDVTGNIGSGTSVTAKATEGNVTIGGSLVSKNGDTMLSATDSQVLDDKGNIKVTGNVDSSADIKMMTENGNIEVGGTTTAAQNIQAKADKTGAILFIGDAQAVAGNLQAETKAGNITFAGRAQSGDDLAAKTENGDIGFAGQVQSGNNLTAETATGDITFAGQTASGRDFMAVTRNKGNITFDGLVSAGQNLMADAVQAGTITLHKDVKAGRDATLKVNDGNMLFVGNDAQQLEDIHLTADEGNVLLQVTGTGDIKDTHRQQNGDRGFVNATNGNVMIKHEGTGDVDLYGIYAKKDAAIELKNGSLYLDNVDGDLVAMFVRNPEKNMDVEHITAGTQIAASGADIGIEDILQREDADDLLTITPNGVREDVPIQNLHIGNIRTNSGSGVRFEHLWLENGDVTVSQGKLFVDKLHVLNKATFSNGMMTTDVFGTAPVYDPAVSSAYWNDINKNRPQDHLDEWLSKASSPRWTYLRFYGQSRTQFSNGNLLNLQDHYYVYRERYTQTDWLRMNTDHEPYNFYETYYHPALSYHERYNLLDTSDLLSWHPDQAESSEIDVDA
ncbi:leukotoxin LktA family filamentous adhesin [Mitsuokella sp. AF21-1AC]|uniref:leukotoxin LktA family filamentous adhesin n=1 Tax=Mitsuokella sp. AF21-1AC TaxID=2292235 RepID=UPI000E4DF759|nr:leukotoxin LktA family filamentous adhesin [Mitsuokella sp. AF21-1AC]RGS74870.1 leukotoxin LktA family filamentous adhesin [Mitsuokella sp. AF21-1AC]